MPRYRRIRKARGTSWTSESSKRANKARWSADRARRDAEMPARIRELAEIEIQNLPRKQGDPVWGIRITNFSTGKVWAWTLRIGKRLNQVTMHSTSGKSSKSVGLTWIMVHLRGYLAGTKTA